MTGELSLVMMGESCHPKRAMVVLRDRPGTGDVRPNDGGGSRRGMGGRDGGRLSDRAAPATIPGRHAPRPPCPRPSRAP